MQLRLIPILLFGSVSLLALKGIDIFMNDGASGAAPAYASGAPKPAPQIGTAERPAEVQAPNRSSSAPEVVPSEKVLNERLSERRQQLDERNKDLEMRENLLKAAEKRLEERLDDVKKAEASAKAAGALQGDAPSASLKNLVMMYEIMKPKDAARIFDKLDIDVLVEVVTSMSPKKMADVLGQMQSESAQRLTVELARRSSLQAKGTSAKGVAAPPPANSRELPRIDQKAPS